MKIDREKAELAEKFRWQLEEIAQTSTDMRVEMPSTGVDDYNYLIHIYITGGIAFLQANVKDVVADAMKAADNVVIVGNNDTVHITLGFMYVWDSEENVNKKHEMDAN